jgi:GNAT superfamily N-acetyltransferase
MIVRQLRAQDAPAYQGVRLRGLQESPMAFSSSYEEESQRTSLEIAARVTPELDGSRCVFGTFDEDNLVGILAFIRPHTKKLRHCGQLAGMFVIPQYRGYGHGRALLDAAVSHARSVGVRQLKLGVNATNIAAKQLYLSTGFTCCGTEPDAILVGGIYYAEETLILRLDEVGTVTRSSP